MANKLKSFVQNVVKDKQREQKIIKANLKARHTKFESFKTAIAPIRSFLGKVYKFGAQIGDNLETNYAREEYGVNIGSLVKIKKGVFTGQKMIIAKFISGGIEGSINNQIIRIRHGSYLAI